MIVGALHRKPRIVVIGGGTGTFTVLSGLRKYSLDLSAVVTMADDGGSTGVLRDELGVLPPGDVRQCLVALSHSPLFLRKLMNYRFAEGGLKGHSFGNLLLSALEKMTGSFDKAVEMAGEVLHIEGRVIPATLEPVRLMADLPRGRKLRREREFHSADLSGMKRIFLRPTPRANPKAVAAIKNADAVVVGPGNFYSSLVPNFLVPGISKAMRKSRAIKIYVCNIMAMKGHTGGFTAEDFVRTMERYVGDSFDHVVYNARRPTPKMLRRYAHEGEQFVEAGRLVSSKRYVKGDFLSRRIPVIPKGDPIARDRRLIRHDPDRLARAIVHIVSGKPLRG